LLTIFVGYRRRAGIGQILLNDVDDAIADVEWIADHGVMGGVLLPGMPPGCGIDPLHSPKYDPVWRACEERGVVLNVHGGSGSPDPGMFPASPAMFVLEASFFAHRPLWALVMSGVFDRFPDIRFYFAETNASWLPGTLYFLDDNYALYRDTFDLELRMKPSEYILHHCYFGIVRDPVALRLGDEMPYANLMWGSDFPHSVGTYPRSPEHLDEAFARVDDVTRRQILLETPAAYFGLDLDAEITPTP